MIQPIDKLTSRANGTHKFSTYAAANAFCMWSTKVMLIVHGDDEKFWVTTPKIAQHLEGLGYENVG